MQPDKSMDQAITYRQLFGRYATGVSVVLGLNGGSVVGMTVNSLTSLSLDPLLLLFCPRKGSRSAGNLLEGGRFSVNILGRSQRTLSQQFASADRQVPSGCAQRDGFAWIDGANAVFLCGVADIHPGGDHSIVVGRVLDMWGPEQSEGPLIFHEGRYAGLACSGETPTGYART
jgi:3-hydroxy-9,10-secoandrosta-1,3,5(10)-triene-9,17-dione monooxygenase reductase component